MFKTSRAIVAALFLVCGLSVPAWAQLEDLPVGVNDVLQIRAAMWNAAEGTVEELVPVAGSYTVGASGTISVPLVGNVTVAGLSTAEIAATLQESMAGFSGAGRTPQVAVSVENYDQIYLSGEVDEPGVYDFKPGMTVLKAVTLAGGPDRLEPIEGQERHFFQARTNARELREELQYLEARRQRLAAEVDDGTMQASGIADGTGVNGNGDFLSGEVEIFNTRKKLFAQQEDYYEKAQAALQETLDVLQKKLATNNEQLEAARAELDREQDLLDKGLAPRVRVFERTRYLGDVESRGLDIERSILTAQQNLREIEEERLLQVSNRAETGVTDLQEVTAKIARARAELEGQYALMSAALGEDTGPSDLAAASTGDPIYRIERTRDGSLEHIDAGPGTIVLPGDVIEVGYPELEDLPTQSQSLPGAERSSMAEPLDERSRP